MKTQFYNLKFWNFILGFLLFISSGCAGSKVVRNEALLLATYSNSVRDTVQKFSDFSRELAQSRNETMDRLESNAFETEIENERQLIIWGMIQKGSVVGLFKAVKKSAETANAKYEEYSRLKNEQKRNAIKVNANKKARSNKLSEAAQTLGQLAEEEDFEDRIKFYSSFFGDVKKSIDDNKDEGEQQSEAGVKEAKKLIEKMPEKKENIEN